MNEEQHLYEILAMLRKEYEKAAQPYLERLAAIQAMKTPPSISVSREQAIALGLLPEEPR